MIRALFRFALLLCIAWSSHAQQREQRVALVIGNGAYQSSPLKNPVNDATDMAQALQLLAQAYRHCQPSGGEFFQADFERRLRGF